MEKARLTGLPGQRLFHLKTSARRRSMQHDRQPRQQEQSERIWETNEKADRAADERFNRRSRRSGLLRGEAR